MCDLWQRDFFARLSLFMGVILSDYERYAAALDASGRYIRDRGYHGA